MAAAAAAATMRGLGQLSRAMGEVGAASSGTSGALARVTRSADAAAESLGGFMGAVQAATATLRAFGRLQDTLGASTGETAVLRILGKTLGIGDLRGMASTFRQSTLGGLGAEAATRHGVRISPLDVGSAVNEGGNFLKFLSSVREEFQKTRDFGRALADLRNAGVENAIQVVRIHDDVWKQIIRDGEEARALLGPEHQTRVVQLDAAMARLSEKWEFLKVIMGSIFIPLLEKVTNGLILFARVLATLPRSGVRQQDIDAALNANTAAQNKNTRALEQMMGIYGGGRRTRSAIPGAFSPGNGFMLADAVRAHTLRLGAYAVSR